MISPGCCPSSYIEKQNTQNIPIAYVGIYNEFFEYKNLINYCDKVLINCYPFWEGAPIEQSSIYLQEMYDKIYKLANKKEIIISETGWPSTGQVVGNAVPSKENFMIYFIEAQEWAASTNVKLFYFSSFDESWKIQYEGAAGVSWGLWDINNNFKF